MSARQPWFDWDDYVNCLMSGYRRQHVTTLLSRLAERPALILYWNVHRHHENMIQLWEWIGTKVTACCCQILDAVYDGESEEYESCHCFVFGRQRKKENASTMRGVRH